MSSRGQRSGGLRYGRTRPHFQRRAVGVTYTKNSTRGQWRAHGRYVARESATHEGDPRAIGFNATEESTDIAARLEGWQKANDERLWKLIVSPEFGDRVDLKRLISADSAGRDGNRSNWDLAQPTLEKHLQTSRV